MPYKLDELLDLFRQSKSAALYLADGFAPAVALTARPPGLPTDNLTSATMCLVEGPPLNRAELMELLEEIRRSSHGGANGYRGWEEYRFKKGTHDFDVYLFLPDALFFMEFRVPNFEVR